MRSTLLTIAFLALAQAAVAQRPAPAEEREDKALPSEDTSAARPEIRVLQSPYDLAGFYRSGGSAGEGWAGLTNDPAYGIAGFYRQHEGGYPARFSPQRYGWSAFWTNGYSARRPRPFPAYRRTIGQNGDLFLVVPFLASVGPISGAFFGY